MNPLRLPLSAAFVVTAFGGLAIGCNSSGGQLRAAASADLHCPKNRVHIIGASKTKDVEACGQRATYRFVDGDWVMVSRDGAAPAGAVPPSSVQAVPPAVTPARTAAGTPSIPPSSMPPPAPGQRVL